MSSKQRFKANPYKYIREKKHSRKPTSNLCFQNQTKRKRLNIKDLECKNCTTNYMPKNVKKSK